MTREGWSPLLPLRALPRRRPVRCRLAGEEMVLLRTRSGHVRLLEAYCPHLGAHLAVGGRVEGETLVCPFHGWRFDTASGRLLEVPYSPRCPKVRLRTAPVAVVDGLVHGFARPEAPGAPVHPR